MGYSTSRTLPTDFDHLTEVETIVAEASAAAGLQDEKQAALLLSASEAATNAMLHGNGMDAGKVVIVEAQASKGEVRISVEDQGAGFDPDAVPNPLAEENLLKTSGRGVFLMRSYCDEVHFANNGRKVTLVVRNDS